MVIGLYVAMWPCHLENPSLSAFLLRGHGLKEISLGSSILLRYPWLFDNWRSWVLAGSNFGLWSFQLEIGNGLYDHWDGFRPSKSVHRYSFKTSTDFKHLNLIWFASYSEHIKFKCSFKTVCMASKFLTYYHCLLHPKKLIKEAMVPLEVFTDHNWRWHIQDPKLPFGVCKKWELSRVHRTKQRGEKLAALIGKQSHVVKTPKEVARHRKPSTAHSAQKRHVKFWGRAAPESPGLTSLQSSTSGTSWKWYITSPLVAMILKRETPMPNFFGMILCLLSLPVKRVWKRPCPVSVSMHGPQTFPPLNSDHRAAPRGRPVTRGVHLGWCRSIKQPPTDPGFSLAVTSGDDRHFAKKQKPLCKPPAQTAWYLGGRETSFSAMWVSSIYHRVSDCSRTFFCLS